MGDAWDTMSSELASLGGWSQAVCWLFVASKVSREAEELHEPLSDDITEGAVHSEAEETEDSDKKLWEDR